MTNAGKQSLAMLLALLLSLGWAQQAGAQDWSVALSGQSNELLDVKILSPGKVGDDNGPIIHNIRFSVTYYDAGGNVIANEDYLYLDDQLRTLVPNVVYERTFIHGQTGVYRVEGQMLTYTGYEGGGAALTSINVAKKQDIGAAGVVISRPQRYIQSTRDYCKSYASAAVDQNRFNALLGCGFKGSRWNGDFGYHLYWCEQAKSGEADSEWHVRTEMLEACRKR